MDTEALEKLNELKEKGVLSQEEFESEKQKLLHPQPTPQASVSTTAPSKDKPIYKYFRECLFSSKYFSIKGRARRKEYWGFILYSLIISLALNLTASGMFSLVLSLIFSLYMIIPSITVTVRRLHDTNRSGWWYGSMFLVLGFGAIIAAIGAIVNYMGYNNPIFTQVKTIIYMILPFISIIISLIILVFTILGSDPKENKYGAIPEGVKF